MKFKKSIMNLENLCIFKEFMCKHGIFLKLAYDETHWGLKLEIKWLQGPKQQDS